MFYESGPRLAAALGDLTAGLSEREAAVCRELTKLHEEVRRGRVAYLAAAYAAAAEPKGEIVLVIGPPPENEGTSPASLDEMLRDALARGSVKDAVAEVATVTGEPRAEVYRRALALTRGERDGKEA